MPYSDVVLLLAQVAAASEVALLSQAGNDWH